MAYVLGFFAADGTITIGKRKNHYIEFTSTDKKIIEAIRSTLRSAHRISIRKRSHPWKTIFRLQIGSKTMVQDLMKFGFVPNKSKQLFYPHVPSRYLSNFTRGYFDGDGHVTMGIYPRNNRPSMNKVLTCGFTSGTKRFLKYLHNDLLQKKIVKGGTLHWHKGYRLNFAMHDSLGLYRFLYKDLDKKLYLPRKKKVFESFMRA